MTGVNQTLFIPLYGKAKVSKKSAKIFKESYVHSKKIEH